MAVLQIKGSFVMVDFAKIFFVKPDKFAAIAGRRMAFHD